ncbi:MAG: sugar porter family MFS transporter [Proteiniphilum sp.]|jgi:sugar porter (SP) family MFS transporter|nr:sugar porter family MFS transporter [Proteiniphilum sp.]
MNTTTRIYIWSLIVALGGFLFGFDTAVISGVEKSIQQLFDLSAWVHGFAISSALIGTIIGAIFAGKPADRYGRRPLLFIIAAGYLLSAAGTALAPNIVLFILFRFLGGIAVGASSVVAPMYISEIAPAHVRGKATASFQLNVIIGILMAFVSNYLLRNSGENAWRYMLAVLALPSALFFIGLFFVPESPRFLIKAGRKEKAASILEKIRTGDIKQEIAEITKNLNEKDGRLFSRIYTKSIMIAFLVAMFNQFSGINAILYFAPRIFELSGLPESTAFFHPVIIGITNALFTLLGLMIVDKVGRRTLLIIGSAGMALCLFPVAILFFMHSPSGLLLVFLVGYILFFAASTGTVIWILISEVFPTGVRGNGQSFGSFTHWFFAALITFFFPVISSTYANGAAYIFTFFGIMMIIQLFTAWKYFPETKGKTIEEISHTLQTKRES